MIYLTLFGSFASLGATSFAFGNSGFPLRTSGNRASPMALPPVQGKPSRIF